MKDSTAAMILFGGCGINTGITYNDVWRLRAPTTGNTLWTWTQDLYNYQGNANVSRAGAAAVVEGGMNLSISLHYSHLCL